MIELLVGLHVTVLALAQRKRGRSQHGGRERPACLLRGWRWLHQLLRAGIVVMPAVPLASCVSHAAPRPAIPSWWLRPDQLGAHSAAGTFAFKFVEIINLDLHAYYALRSSAPGPPQVAARMSAAAYAPQNAEAHAARAWVQSFGQLGDIDVG